MKALVTGGAGFIGSHVAEILKENNHEVLIVDNFSTGKKSNLPKDIPFLEIDICSKELNKAISEFKPDVVFHLAAQIDVQKSLHDPAFDAYVNVVGAVNLLQACQTNKVKKVIYSSSAAVYGEPQSLPVSESHQLMPLSAYGVSKHTVEHYLYVFKNLYNIDYSILRYGNVYGPRQDPLGEAGVVAIFTDKILKGQSPMIFGDGEQTRDFVYVKDIARANLLAATTSSSQVVNIATEVETSVNDVFNLLLELTNQKELKAQTMPSRSGEIRRMVMSTKKAKREIGFESKFSFYEGMKETIEFYKAQIDF
ncbi:MAG TPA: NAD-dependent epimerase/dehydratase family protein [Firmicutes bacterium]|nr:NAD-dependent epimerase/dehydratase family protein [Bacillota bacterium]